MKLKWNEVTKENVINAINKFLIEKPKCPEPRNTYLIYNGMKLPAKHIRGMAYEVAFNILPSKSDFSGGKETKQFFEKLGFEVLYQTQKKRR